MISSTPTTSPLVALAATIFLIFFTNCSDAAGEKRSRFREESTRRLEGVNEKAIGGGDSEGSSKGQIVVVPSRDDSKKAKPREIDAALCCDEGWHQFEAKCYQAYDTPVTRAHQGYVCYEQDGYVYPVNDFESAGEYRFLSSNWDLRKFWPIHFDDLTADKDEYGEFCRTDVKWECPAQREYLQKWTAEKDEIEKAKNAKVGERCCEEGWTLIQGLCYKTFNEKIKPYEEPMKCEEHGGRSFVIKSRDVDALVRKELGNANRYMRQEHGTQKGYACMEISKECGKEGENGDDGEKDE